MPVTLKQRQKINHELKSMGFGGIDDPMLFAQIATLYSTHDSFRGLLMSTAPNQRRIAYESLKPHLSFVPKPLDAYEMEIKERAEREQWDIYDGTAYPKPFKVGEVESPEYRLAKLANEAIAQNEHEAKGGILELVCTKCTSFENFPAKTRKEALKQAQAKGWRWTDDKKAYCAEHVPSRLSMNIQCSECERVDRIRAWDEQDGYSKARLAGWTITDTGCQCSRCASKLILMQ